MRGAGEWPAPASILYKMRLHYCMFMATAVYMVVIVN